AAVLGGFRQVVELLLKAGAVINTEGKRKHCRIGLANPLQVASYHGHRETVKLLLDAGADVNAQGGSLGNALYAATYNDHPDVVKLLL
ncbi:ankyrin, partial [Periconia macrospinosa]